ncbi:hypothetical protein ACT691_12625 [Vibrio metschnikovii]
MPVSCNTMLIESIPQFIEGIHLVLAHRMSLPSLLSWLNGMTPFLVLRPMAAIC